MEHLSFCEGMSVERAACLTKASHRPATWRRPQWSEWVSLSHRKTQRTLTEYGVKVLAQKEVLL